MKYYDYNKLDLEKLEGLEKITVVKISEFGYPVVINIRKSKACDWAIIKDWAQYKNCIQFQGILPIKRKANAWLVRENEEFYCYEGTITEEQFKSFKTIVSENEDVKVESWGPCFSDGALDAFVNGCDVEPIFSSKDAIKEYTKR